MLIHTYHLQLHANVLHHLPKKSKTLALFRHFLYYLINTACFTRYCYSQGATPQLIRVGKFDKNKIRSFIRNDME